MKLKLPSFLRRLCGVLGLLAIPVLGSAQSAKPTNVVFFLVDDLGWMDISPNNPKTFYETPNLQRFAESGMRFTAGYAACPVCSPTRSSIMTGQYPARTRNTDYFGAPNGFKDGVIPDPYDPDRDGKFGKHGERPVRPAPYAERLAADHTTLAEALKSNGYTAFFAGKWHLGPEGSWPEDHGFDVNKGGVDRGGPYGGKKYFSPYGNPRLADGPEGEHLPDRLATETAKFITDHKEGPFLAYLSFYSVHTPLIGRPDLVEKYEKKRAEMDVSQEMSGEEFPRPVRIQQAHAVYAAMVEAMDLAVGKVLDAVDAAGIRDNTLVIFFSDNGGLATSEGWPTSNLPLRAGKGWLYEGGIREPLLVRWPGVTQPGSVCDTPVISTDFFPTILDVCGLSALPRQHKDGASFAALLRDSKASFDPRRALFWHYPHWGNQGGTPGSAIREGDWKLIEWDYGKEPELFHLGNDLSESKNLAKKQPEKAAELAAKLDALRKETKAIPTSKNPKFQGKFEKW
ncbi:MAG: sulfatase [Verrucomicrobiae bacterium]|nr:sulfatase [Verrucomicrobiae bacterium]